MSSRDPEQLLYGIHAVGARLASGIGLRRLIIKEGQLNQRLEALRLLGVKVGCPIERRSIEDLIADPSPSNPAHQGVALYVAPLVLGNVSDLDLLISNKQTELLLLLLDGITDPRNLGACLRSAGSMHVDAVILPKNRSAPLNAAAIKTASGALGRVPLIQVVNLGRCMEHLKASNVWFVGTTLDADTALHEIDLTGNIALVMGAEDRGIGRKTRDKCDFLAQIHTGHVEGHVEGHADLGLNVSVATGICLYEACRQRNAQRLATQGDTRADFTPRQ